MQAYDRYVFAENPNIKVMVIGDGKQFKKIEKYIEKSKQEEDNNNNNRTQRLFNSVCFKPIY